MTVVAVLLGGLLIRTGRRAHHWPMMLVGWMVLSGAWFVSGILAIAKMND